MLFLLLYCTQLCNAQVRSAQSGAWSDRATWQGNRLPEAGEAVEILNGHHVRITGPVSCGTIRLIPPHNSSNEESAGLIVESGAALTATSLVLEGLNKRRFALFINRGGNITLTGQGQGLYIESGNVLQNEAGSISVRGSLVNNGTIDIQTARLEIGSNYSGYGNFTSGIGTVVYNGTAVAGQTIAALPYHHLRLTGNNNKSTAAALSVSGNLEVGTGTTLLAGAHIHTIAGDLINYGSLISESISTASITVGGSLFNSGAIVAGASHYYIGGNWSNTGNFQAGTSTIWLQGSRLQEVSGGTTFYNLRSTGTAGALLQQHVTVTNELSITRSHLNTGAHVLYLGPAASIVTPETDAAHLLGTVIASRTVTTTPERFGNIGMTLSRNEIDPGRITVERVTGVSTEIAAGTESITRQYHISREGTNDITALRMNLELGFLPKELKAMSLKEYTLYNKAPGSQAVTVSGEQVAPYTLRHSNSNRFGTYTLAPPPVPMPVELAWFRAQRRNQAVILQWQTVSASDNKGFEVQTSADGRTYHTLAFVPAITANSNTPQAYAYTHSNPAPAQTLYYRLKQVDYSGTYTFSKTITIQTATPLLTTQVAPNPFTDHIRLTIAGTQAYVTLTDLNGKAVLQQAFSAQHLTPDGYYRLNTGQLIPGGVYLLTVQTPEQVYRTKLLKE
ncbi:MAG TPA: T9SS type A sorting domain-containing protein [Pontibacter sp.]